jgi:transposase-like protein
MSMMSSGALGGVECIADVVRCQYELTQLDSGAAVYAFTGFPKHYVCPYCFEQARMHVLQYRRVGNGYFACPGCRVSFPVQRAPGYGALV